jgi:hypothetical protein
MRFNYNSLYFGLILGLLAPWIIVVTFYQVKFGQIKFYEFLELAYYNQIFTTLLSLCALINLGIFYLFIWTHKDFAAKGVLGATFLYALVIFAMKLM